MNFVLEGILDLEKNREKFMKQGKANTFSEGQRQDTSGLDTSRDKM